jgi:hypothetical protein
MLAPVDDMKEGRGEFVAAEGSHEFRIDLRISFEPGGDIGPRFNLDFADKMAERRRPEAVQILDEALAAEPKPRFAGAARVAMILGLRCFAVHARLPCWKAKLASSRAQSGRTRKRRVKKMA